MKQKLKQIASNAALAAVAVAVLFGLACCTQSAYAATSGPDLYTFTGHGSSVANTGRLLWQ